MKTKEDLEQSQNANVALNQLAELDLFAEDLPERFNAANNTIATAFTAACAGGCWSSISTYSSFTQH